MQEKLSKVINILLQSYRCNQNDVSFEFSDLSNYEKYYCRKYESLEIFDCQKIILKRITHIDDLKYILPIKEFFDIIAESDQDTGHGGYILRTRFYKILLCTI